MTANSTGIRIIIYGSPGDLVEERVRIHEIVAGVMSLMSRGRKV